MSLAVEEEEEEEEEEKEDKHEHEQEKEEGGEGEEQEVGGEVEEVTECSVDETFKNVFASVYLGGKVGSEPWVVPGLRRRG